MNSAELYASAASFIVLMIIASLLLGNGLAYTGLIILLMVAGGVLVWILGLDS